MRQTECCNLPIPRSPYLVRLTGPAFRGASRSQTYFNSNPPYPSNQLSLHEQLEACCPIGLCVFVCPSYFRLTV